MGNVLEQFFDGIEECPKCKSRRLRAEIVKSNIVKCNKETDEYWELGDEFDEGDVKIFCDKCNTEIEGI